MILDTKEVKHIYIATQYVDMRKSINGLSILVGYQFQMDVLDKCLLEMEYICAAETTVQVLKEVGKAASSKSYMWVYKSGRSEDKQLVLYQYVPSRIHEHVIQYLEGYQGILQSDYADNYFNEQSFFIISSSSYSKSSSPNMSMSDWTNLSIAFLFISTSAYA